MARDRPPARMKAGPGERSRAFAGGERHLAVGEQTPNPQPPTPNPRFWRPALLLLAAAAALTGVLAARTFWYLFHAVSNVPFTDGWVILDEIRRFREGALDWTFFWAPYWGQRNMTARVLFLLAAKYFSFAALPLVLVNVAAWLAMLAVLIAAARRLFPERPLIFWLCVVALAHLLLSSLGMEVLVITQNVQHSVGYASSVAAIVLFERRPWVAVALGVLATASIAIGLLVWPILLLEAWRARMPLRGLILLAALTVAVIALYLIGYTRPPAYGMGVGGALRHPLVALQMTSLVLGGPITLYSLRLGTAAGAVGLAALLWFLWRAASGSAFFAMLMAACFLAASAAALAAGRISPEWLANLHGAQPLPSRYIAPVLVFWGCLFALGLRHDHLPPRAIVCAPRLAVCAIVAAMTFGTWPWQWRVSREWVVAFQKFDAIGSGFLAGVSDPESMSFLIADAPLRDRTADYLRREHLAVFAEPRAAWIGRQIAASAPVCQGSFSVTPVGNGLRVTGTVEFQGSFDLLVVAPDGAVVGVARSLPAQSEGHTATDFFGYARPGASRVFVAQDRRPVCEVRENGSHRVMLVPG